MTQTDSRRLTEANWTRESLMRYTADGKPERVLLGPPRTQGASSVSGETPNEGQSGVASQAPQPYSEGVQGIDYAYTIRGWLRGINANSLSGIDDIYDTWDGMSGEDKWGMSIGYTEPSCNIEGTDGGQVRYDGSPSWMMWARINSSPLNGLKMTYDTADRLLKATGVAYQSGCNWLIDNKFSETFSYGLLF